MQNAKITLPLAQWSNQLSYSINKWSGDDGQSSSSSSLWPCRAGTIEGAAPLHHHHNELRRRRRRGGHGHGGGVEEHDEQEEEGRPQNNALHLRQRGGGEARRGGVLHQHAHVPHHAAPHAARQGRHHAHQLRRHLRRHAAHRRLPRRRLHRPLLDHRRRLRRLPTRHGAADGVGGTAAVPAFAVPARRRGGVPGGGAVAAGGAVRVAAPQRGGRRRVPALHRGLRRRPVRRVAGGGARALLGLLQLVLLLQRRVHAGGRHGGGVRAGQRRLGMGPRRAGRLHGRLRRRLRRRVPGVPPPRPRGEPLHAARAGGCRRRQEAAPAGGRRRRRGAVRERRPRRAHLHVRQARPHGPAQLLRPRGGGHRRRPGPAGRRLLRQTARPEPVAPEHGAPRGGAQVGDPHGPHLGGGHPGDHGVVDAAHLLPAAGDHHGPPPRAGPLGVPDPRGFHDRLRAARHAPHPLRLRPRARPGGAPRHGARPRHLLPPPHGRRLRAQRARHAGRRPRRAPPQGRGGGGGGRHGRRHVAAVRLLAGAPVRAARRGRGLHLRGAPRVHVRPGAREHAQHGHGALLAVHLAGELREHGAGGRRAPVERRPRRRQLAAGQHQPRQVRLLLLGRHDAAGREPGVLRHLRQAVHVQARAAPHGSRRGRRRRRQGTGGAAGEGLSSIAPMCRYRSTKVQSR